MMTDTGVGSAFGSGYENRYVSTKQEITEKQEPAGEKYKNAAAYYDYLKSKYESLNTKEYKVTISPALLEKCINDPEKAELLEKNLAHIPVSHRYFTAAWSALGAKVVNQEFIFDENGNCGGSTNTYVTNSSAPSGDAAQDKISEKKGPGSGPSLQEQYEKRKRIREQFEERLAEKKYLKEQLAEEEVEEELLNKGVLAKEQNKGRFMERYEANILSYTGRSNAHIRDAFGPGRTAEGAPEKEDAESGGLKNGN